MWPAAYEKDTKHHRLLNNARKPTSYLLDWLLEKQTNRK